MLESSGHPLGGLDSIENLCGQGNPTNHVQWTLRRPRCAPQNTELEAVACSRQLGCEHTGAQTGCSKLSWSCKGARKSESLEA